MPAKNKPGSKRLRNDPRNEKDEIVDSLIDKHAHSRGGQAAYLRSRLDLAMRDYVTYVGRGEDFTKMMTARDRMESLDRNHNIFVDRMALACLASMADEVSPATVIKAASTAMAMWTLAPEFRDRFRQVGEDARDGFKNSLKATIDKKRAKAEETGKPLSKSWDRALKTMAHIERGGRPPMTAYSAGLTEVGLTNQAFRLMRVEGADVAQIQKNYEAMVSSLYERAARDGVASKDVAGSARQIIMDQIAIDPEQGAVYEDLAHGRFFMSEVDMTDGRTGRVFCDPATDKIVDAGSFYARKPMSRQDHVASLSLMFAKDLQSSEPDERQLTLFGNASGLGFIEADNYDIPETIRPEDKIRMARVRSAVMAMRADGMSRDECIEAYHQGFSLGLDDFCRSNPEQVKSWERDLGSDWRARVADVARDPQKAAQEWIDAYERSQARFDGTSHAGDHGANESSSKKSRARREQTRTNQRYNQTETGDFTGIGVDDAVLIGEVVDDGPELGG